MDGQWRFPAQTTMIQPHAGDFWLMTLVSPTRRCLRPSLANYPDLQLLEECKDEMGEELLPAVSGDSRSTGDFSAKEIFDVIHMVAKMI